MSQITPKKYEKVDDHTLRIIAEKVDDVEFDMLIRNRDIMREQVEKQEKTLNITKERLAQIDMFIIEAIKLGIKEEEKDVNPSKSEK